MNEKQTERMLALHRKYGATMGPFEEHRRGECSSGIHFLITREEAVGW